jgi:hypothetical protein
MTAPPITAPPADRPLTDADRTHIDRLLEQWLSRARVALSAYNDATTRTLASERRLGVPAVICSALVATGLFATLQKDPALGWRIATGVIAVLAAVLGSLQTFLRQAERAEQYREAARSYGRVRRRIERARLFPPTTRSEAEQLLDDLGEALADAAHGKPNLPQRIWDRAEYKVKRMSDARGVRALLIRMRDRFDFGLAEPPPRLPEEHARYFSGLDEATIVPVWQVSPSADKDAPASSVATARTRMREAAAGARTKRPPIDVRPSRDGRYEIVDGNATFAVAAEEGWQTVPVRVADGKAGA